MNNNDIKLLTLSNLFITQFNVDTTTYKHEKDSLTIYHQCLKDLILRLILRKLKNLNYKTQTKHHLIPNWNMEKSKWPAAGHAIQNTKRPADFFPKYRKLLTKINIECSYIEKESSSDSEAGVRRENRFVVYARHTILVKLTSPSMTNVTIKYKIGNRWTFKMLLQSFFIDQWKIHYNTLVFTFDAFQKRNLDCRPNLVFWVTWPAVSFTTAMPGINVYEPIFNSNTGF